MRMDSRAGYYNQNMDEKEAEDLVINPKESHVDSKTKAQLLEWGVTEEEIDEISKVVEDLDYDSCEKKITRLVNTPCYQALVDQNNWITIPEYHDPVGRDDGVCEDLAKRLLINLSDSGLLKKLSPRIDFFASTGLSRTHFNTENSKHVWIETAPKGFSADDRVVIDPSFRKVEFYRTSGYIREKKTRENPSEHILTIYPAEEIKVISIDDLVKYNQSPDGNVPYKVLGCSSDFQRIYGIGFYFNNSEDSHPRPYLQVSFADRDDPPISVTFFDGHLNVLSGNTNDLMQPVFEEITHLSALLQEMRVEFNPEKAKEASQRKIKFDLKY